MLSTYNNSKASNFNQGRRFSRPTESRLDAPGPGTYEAVGDVRDGKQSCSNYHSILTRTFKTTEEQRPTQIMRFKTPGPGTYRPPSDFGYMDSLIAPKDTESIMESNFDRSTRKVKNASFMKAHSPNEKIK
jgi:hypothetical protein